MTLRDSRPQPIQLIEPPLQSRVRTANLVDDPFAPIEIAPDSVQKRRRHSIRHTRQPSLATAIRFAHLEATRIQCSLRRVTGGRGSRGTETGYASPQ